MNRLATYSIEKIFALMDQNKQRAVAVGEFRIKLGSHRLRLFKEKGIRCVECGIEGEFFALESATDETPHLNLYAVSSAGRDILMTKDHIIPKSKGGANTLENYQTMCTLCNAEKADSF